MIGQTNPNKPTMVFYNYDHLGNTRITYTCKVEPLIGTQTTKTYTAISLFDYDPYGKVLRSYGNEKYLTTYHERDVETGLDYRGARFYDGETYRFLSLDPLQAKYPSVSSFSYVLGNPLALVDANGKEATPPIKYSSHQITMSVEINPTTHYIGNVTFTETITTSYTTQVVDSNGWHYQETSSVTTTHSETYTLKTSGTGYGRLEQTSVSETYTRSDDKVRMYGSSTGKMRAVDDEFASHTTETNKQPNPIGRSEVFETLTGSERGKIGNGDATSLKDPFAEATSGMSRTGAYAGAAAELASKQIPIAGTMISLMDLATQIAQDTHKFDPEANKIILYNNTKSEAVW